MVATQHLHSTLQQHWSESASSGIPTLYPGTRQETSQLPEWFELWVDALSDQPSRRIAPDRLDGTITVHCFTQQRHHPARVYELADLARQALDHQRLRILDRSATPPLEVGHVDIYEPQIRDLSRTHQNAGSLLLRHIVLTWSFVAQKTTSSPSAT
ncbi:MAG: hypothetical protein R3B90_05600 [Planctomycetaceae bacterium]